MTSGPPFEGGGPDAFFWGGENRRRTAPATVIFLLFIFCSLNGAGVLCPCENHIYICHARGFLPAAAGAESKGNAVQDRDYARSCESLFFRPYNLSHCPSGGKECGRGRVRRPASAAARIALRDMRDAATTFFSDFFALQRSLSGIEPRKRGRFASPLITDIGD